MTKKNWFGSFSEDEYHEESSESGLRPQETAKARKKDEWLSSYTLDNKPNKSCVSEPEKTNAVEIGNELKSADLKESSVNSINSSNREPVLVWRLIIWGVVIIVSLGVILGRNVRLSVSRDHKFFPILIIDIEAK